MESITQFTKYDLTPQTDAIVFIMLLPSKAAQRHVLVRLLSSTSWKLSTYVTDVLETREI